MVADPNLAIAMIAIGLLGIYAEFCLPGKVLPGVLGGIFLLIGTASLVNAPASAAISWPFVTALFLALLAITTYLLRIAVRARRNKQP